MNSQNEVRELKSMAKAFSAVAFILWSVLPMHVLGWLVSAIARHEAAEKELVGEPVYWVISHWQGGINSYPPVILLIFFFCVLFILS